MGKEMSKVVRGSFNSSLKINSKNPKLRSLVSCAYCLNVFEPYFCEDCFLSSLGFNHFVTPFVRDKLAVLKAPESMASNVVCRACNDDFVTICGFCFWKKFEGVLEEELDYYKQTTGKLSFPFELNKFNNKSVLN